MNEIEVAWAAGFYEGEGNCYANLKSLDYRPTGSLNVNLTQVTRGPLDKFLSIFPNGKMYFTERSGNASNIWRLAYFGQNAIDVFQAMRPHLSERRIEQFESQLAKISNAVELRSTMPKKPRKKLESCRKNHPFTDDNVYIDPRGTRHCRECRRAAQRRHYAKSV